MQYGFVIDHGRCIGCHACTVACKAENDVPLGDFRTWVKYTESGTFPNVRRDFAVLRCNQCSDAPCVTICPVNALEKRDDGIVDIDPARCIGCKGCMQACPYDALYIDEEEGVAEKCHFCAHRVERGLAPACAVVCPTEAIIPGDFDDPDSRVSQLRAGGDLKVRKPEAGTGPNVFYREAAPAGLEPLSVNHASGYLWAQQLPGPQLEAQRFEALADEARTRATYDVAHPPRWGGKLTGYLFFKSVAAGVWLAGLPYLPPFAPSATPRTSIATALVSLVALAVTSALLVLDLKRPERFLYILRYPNWDSWLARGSFVLMAHGGVASLWLLLGLLAIELPTAVAGALTATTVATAAATAAYTAWLFQQARGRALWLQRGYAWTLIAQAFLAGAATWAIATAVAPTVPIGPARVALAVGIVVNALSLLTAGVRAPRGREEEYRRSLRLISSGPYRNVHRFGVVALGLVLPLLAIVLLPSPAGMAFAGVLAFAGLLAEEDIFIRAGQALPIS